MVTSPATCTWPVVISVSTATRLAGSCASSASRIESLIWSAILSGWPSVTDSDVNRRRVTGAPDSAVIGQIGRSLDERESRPATSRQSGARPRPTPRRRAAPSGRAGRRSRLPSAPRITAALSGWPNALPDADGVDDEQVAALAGQLGAAVVEDVAVSSPVSAAKPTMHLAGSARGDQLGQHVRVLGQLDRRRRAVGLLDLVVGRRRRAEVGDGGGHHDDVGVLGGLVHRVAQLVALTDADDVDAGRVGQARRSRRPA